MKDVNDWRRKMFRKSRGKNTYEITFLIGRRQVFKSDFFCFVLFSLSLSPDSENSSVLYDNIVSNGVQLNSTDILLNDTKLRNVYDRCELDMLNIRAYILRSFVAARNCNSDGMIQLQTSSNSIKRTCNQNYIVTSYSYFFFTFQLVTDVG